jgi:hypothetical protein
MRTNHLSEDAIQQYALDAPGCKAEVIEHLGCCETCKTRLANYQSLFAAMKEQPGPAFEFDVAGLILPQLQGEKRESTRRDWPLYLLVSVVFSLSGFPLYYLRKDIVIMFAGMLPMAIGLAVLSTFLVFLFQGIELLKKYKSSSDALNF